MKKYLIWMIILVSTIGFSQDKTIKNHILNGVKFSVDKNYWLQIEYSNGVPDNQFLIVEMRKLNYPYYEKIESSSISYTSAIERNQILKSGHQIDSGSYLFRVVISEKNDDGGIDHYKIIKLEEKLVKL